jgi:hypothetical protein
MTPEHPTWSVLMANISQPKAANRVLRTSAIQGNVPLLWKSGSHHAWLHAARSRKPS